MHFHDLFQSVPCSRTHIDYVWFRISGRRCKRVDLGAAICRHNTYCNFIFDEFKLKVKLNFFEKKHLIGWNNILVPYISVSDMD